MRCSGLKCTPEKLWAKNFFPALSKKKILINQGCTLEQILVWQDCRQLNKLSNGMPNIEVEAILHGVLVHQSKNLLFFTPFLTLATILV